MVMDGQHVSLAEWDAAIEIWEGTSEATGVPFYYLASEWPDEMVAEFAFLRLPLSRAPGRIEHSL